MDDAIEATVKIMSAPESQIKIRSSYNLSAISFTPEQLAKSIRKYIPDFEMSYEPDFRQGIADSWPSSIDDISSREDWGWENKYDLDKITEEMIEGLKPKISIKF
jgi:nucleoside-diphosphate-sugar epimerase